MREASLGALLVEGTVEDSKDIPLVEKRHFEEAFLKVKPSITEKVSNICDLSVFYEASAVS